ncbi:hypothetical protein SDC9_121423 [bioreactor metagenome]|uniref:Uncharacterized protein n=1 Tax=bioreactor metagenome TaxID=1076179 RepID=A0A645CBX8_9ZZZZ
MKAKKNCIETIKTWMKLFVSPNNFSKSINIIKRAIIVDTGSQDISNIRESIQCKTITAMEDTRNLSKAVKQYLSFE